MAERTHSCIGKSQHRAHSNPQSLTPLLITSHALTSGALESHSHHLCCRHTSFITSPSPFKQSMSICCQDNQLISGYTLRFATSWKRRFKESRTGLSTSTAFTQTFVCFCSPFKQIAFLTRARSGSVSKFSKNLLYQFTINYEAFVIFPVKNYDKEQATARTSISDGCSTKKQVEAY